MSRSETRRVKSRYFTSTTSAAEYEIKELPFSYFVDDMIPSPWTKKEKALLSQIVAGYPSKESLPWAQIASQFADKTAMECFMLFKNELDEDLNKGVWSKEENARLIDLAVRYDEHDWVSVAAELDTCRSPMQCLAQYQQCNNLNLINSGDWSEEELETLRLAVDMYGEHDWQHVANTLPGRTHRQCLMRWRKMRDANRQTGPWSMEEEMKLFFAAIALEAPTLAKQKFSSPQINELDALFASGEDASVLLSSVPTGVLELDKVSKEGVAVGTGNALGVWKQLSILVGGRYLYMQSFIPRSRYRHIYVCPRDELQVRDKWFRDLDPTASRGEPFSEVEDRRLLSLTAVKGPGNWAAFAAWFPGRSDNDLLRRWKQIERINYFLKSWLETFTK